jgi:UDPglucose 6-dehydrogenase
LRAGFIGLGKLGLPMALAAQAAGHQVAGWDVSPIVRSNIDAGYLPYREQGAADLLTENGMGLKPVMSLVDWASIIFLVIQTPHDPSFEGVTPLPDERADFDYTYLIDAASEVSVAADRCERDITMVVVSTVLPGTIERHIQPVISDRVRLVYNPSFIAMGTAISDFTDPEFVLVGTESDRAFRMVERFYSDIHGRPIFRTTVPTAELTKVAYNVYLGAKIEFANTMAMLCDATGADVDDMTEALGMATRRLISTSYMAAGMGDGGGCHPRDVIALSWLSRKHMLPYDRFEQMAANRDLHTRWLAQIAVELADEARLPIIVFGRAYKAESNITVGSPARLLTYYLAQMPIRRGGLHRDATVKTWDPFVDDGGAPAGPAVYVIATAHDEFADYPYPVGSVVLDPWGMTQDRAGVRVVRPGRQ